MIYSDYNGSAPICSEVKKYLIDRLNNDGPYANPNAIHFLGGKCLRAMEKARKTCAEVLGAKPDNIFFNSGSSEGISTIFYSIEKHCADKPEKRTIVISSMEHSATLNAAKNLESQGYKLEWIPTLPSGLIDFNFLDAYIPVKKKEIALVVVMAANNETGVIQPYKQIAALANSNGVLYFSDTTQLIGKDLFNFEQSGIDFAVASGHKVGALTGTGLLLAKEPTLLAPIIFGGGQEKGLRGGTQNYIGNETLAVALKAFQENAHKLENLKSMREKFERDLKHKLPSLVILGENSPRIPNTCFLAYPGVHGQAVQIELEGQNIFVTTSSACSDNEPVTSKVLKSMGVEDQVGRGAVRVSFGLCHRENDFEELQNAIVKAYYKLLKIKF